MINGSIGHNGESAHGRLLSAIVPVDLHLVAGRDPEQACVESWIVNDEDLVDSRERPPNHTIAWSNWNVGPSREHFPALDGRGNISVRVAVVALNRHAVRHELVKHQSFLLCSLFW